MTTSYLRVALIAVVLLSRTVAASAMTSTSTCMPGGDVDKLQVAAAKGDTNAMFQLACIYQQGSGVSKDRVKAAQCYRKAADGGNTSAMVLYGHLGRNTGYGVPLDDAQSAAWYRKAANLGDASGMFWLGMAYWTGRGVSPDSAEAYKWLNLSAANGQGDTRKRSADVRALVAKKLPPYLIADALKRQQAWQAAFDARKK
jgi:TPR repeat protein